MTLSLMTLSSKLLVPPHLNTPLRQVKMLHLPNILSTKKGKMLDYLLSLESGQLGYDTPLSHLNTTNLVVINPRKP